MQFKIFNFIFYMGIATFTYFNIYFKSIGLSSTQIGHINSIAKGISLLILPLWGMASDYYKVNKRLLLVALAGVMLASSSFLLTENFVFVFLVMTVFLIFLTPVVPLVDAQLLGYLGDQSDQYGKYRIWGSIGFTILVPLIGFFLEQTNPGNLFYISGGVFLLALLVASTLPTSDVKLKVSDIRQFKLLFGRTDLLIFIVFEFFIYLTFNVYNIFFPIYVMDHGGGESLVGIALMIAAISEMGVFYFSEQIIDRFKLRYIFLVSALAFALRWAIISQFPIPAVLLTSQLLHSLTFGLFHVTSVNFVNLISGERFQATGQNLYATSKGVSAIVGSAVAGWIYDNLGGSALFLNLSLVALIAGVIYFLILNYQAQQKEYAEKI